MLLDNHILESDQAFYLTIATARIKERRGFTVQCTVNCEFYGENSLPSYCVIFESIVIISQEALIRINN